MAPDGRPPRDPDRDIDEAGHEAGRMRRNARSIKCTGSNYTTSWKSLDYVAGWFAKAAWYSMHANSYCALVATNSICQGEQVSILRPIIHATGQSIRFAHTSFKWSNLASHNAGVIVVVIGLGRLSREARLYDPDESGKTQIRRGLNINPYLVLGPDIIVTPVYASPDERGTMIRGNMPSVRFPSPAPIFSGFLALRYPLARDCEQASR